MVFYISNRDHDLAVLSHHDNRRNMIFYSSKRNYDPAVVIAS